MFKIGDFSKLTFVSIRMLRYYDEKNLLKPSHVDEMTNYRYYSARQIPVLNLIVTLRDFGLTTLEIKAIINETDANKQKEMLKQKELEITDKLKQDQIKLQNLSKYITHYEEEMKLKKYEATIKHVEPIKVLSLRRNLNAYNEEGVLWEEMFKIIGKHQLPVSHTAMAIFRDNETDMCFDVEIAVTVPELRDNVETLVYQELDELPTAVSVLVTGPYEPNIQEGFNFVAKWIEDNNKTMTGPARTVYLKGYGTEKDPNNFLTEIIIPIK